MKWYRVPDDSEGSPSYPYLARDGMEYIPFSSANSRWETKRLKWFDEHMDTRCALLEVALITGTTGPDV